jgi:hypothetical protein
MERLFLSRIHKDRRVWLDEGPERRGGGRGNGCLRMARYAWGDNGSKMVGLECCRSLYMALSMFRLAESGFATDAQGLVCLTYLGVLYFVIVLWFVTFSGFTQMWGSLGDKGNKGVPTKLCMHEGRRNRKGVASRARP